MRSFKKFAVAAGIVTGSATALAGNVDSLIIDLALPVDNTVTYYNGTTRMAASENCRKTDRTVICDMRVTSLETKLDYNLRTDYGFNAVGKVTVHSQLVRTSSWDTDITGHHNKDRKAARSYDWSNTSILAIKAKNLAQDILQNKIGLIEMPDPYIVKVCSSIPVNEKRGFLSCATYDYAQNAGTVQSSVMPRLAIDGVITEGNAVRAQRPFEYAREDKNDFKYFADKYKSGKLVIGLP